jgi:hypothetical protein
MLGRRPYLPKVGDRSALTGKQLESNYFTQTLLYAPRFVVGLCFKRSISASWSWGSIAATAERDAGGFSPFDSIVTLMSSLIHQYVKKPPGGTTSGGSHNGT